MTAFSQVAREYFVRAVIGPAGRPVPVTPDLVYSDDALVTRMRDGWPSSSSSQPSLMARMLAALELRPGLRVLEIGAGTGYNAALITTITGAPVVSVEVQPDVVDDARAALDAAGITGVEVRLGDGYLGDAAHAPYDRIIATVGVGGIPPSWLDQLAPDGLILAPVEHGGLQPCLVAQPDTATGFTGRGALPAGFMLAAGRLHPHARSAAEPLPVPEPPPVVPVPPVTDRRYYDLWFALATRDTRIGRRDVAGFDPTTCVLADPHDGAVLIQPDALRPVGATPALVAHARSLVAEWHRAGGPPVSAWRCGFHLTDGLWVPVNWRRQPASWTSEAVSGAR